MAGTLKTRLDPLVKWKERELEKAKRELAEKLAALNAVQARLAKAAADLISLPASARSADDWDLVERAAQRARADLAEARKVAAAADQAVRASQEASAAAHRQLETFRRVNDRQRDALVREIERQEQKTLDELALLLRKP